VLSGFLATWSLARGMARQLPAWRGAAVVHAAARHWKAGKAASDANPTRHVTAAADPHPEASASATGRAHSDGAAAPVARKLFVGGDGSEWKQPLLLDDGASSAPRHSVNAPTAPPAAAAGGRSDAMRIARALAFYVFHRYARLAPPVGVMIAFLTCVVPLLGSGPLWGNAQGFGTNW
jgi:hypothetical protein